MTIDTILAPTGTSFVQGGDAVYATARSTSTTYSTDNNLAVGQVFLANYTVRRAFLRFDTSSIPDGAVITQVYMRLTIKQDLSTTDFDVEIIEQDWSSQYPIDNTNRETAYDNCLAATSSFVWQNTSGLSIDTQYNSANLSTAYVNKTGYTYYSLRSSRDYNNITPTGNERIDIYDTTNAGSDAQKPALIVTYMTDTFIPRTSIFFG